MMCKFCKNLTLTGKASILYCQSVRQSNNVYIGAILPLLECHCWVQLHFQPQGGAMVGWRQTDGSTLSCFLCCCPYLVWAAPAPDHWSSPFSSWGLWPASRRRVMIRTLWEVECLQWCINIIRAGFSHLFTFNWTPMSQWRVKPIQLPRIHMYWATTIESTMCCCVWNICLHIYQTRSSWYDCNDDKFWTNHALQLTFFLFFN